jgi:cell wall-associated NlpC family hydrolase
VASRQTPRLMLTLGVTGLASALALTVLPATASLADPRPTLQQVQQRIDALNTKVDLADEQYASSRLELAATSRRAAVAQGRVRTAQQELSSLRQQMGAVAAAAYRSGGTDQFVQLVSTSTPQTFLDRASSLDRIAAGQNAQLAAAATARHRLAAAQAEAAQEQRAQEAVARTMSDAKAEIESALAQQQQLLSSLKAEERARLVAAQARARAAAAAAARASRTRALAAARAAAQAVTAQPVRAVQTVQQAGTSSTPTYSGPASGRASVAVQEAYNKLGSPYQWAAAGPDRFDCSGLTMWVWAKAGVSLPHSAAAQYSSGPHVSRSDLQPGDLAFFGSPIHHVGIYIGNGQMISAPHTGDVVKVQDAFRSDYVGAVRP